MIQIMERILLSSSTTYSILISCPAFLKKKGFFFLLMGLLNRYWQLKIVEREIRILISGIRVNGSWCPLWNGRNTRPKQVVHCFLVKYNFNIIYKLINLSLSWVLSCCIKFIQIDNVKILWNLGHRLWNFTFLD